MQGGYSDLYPVAGSRRAGSAWRALLHALLELAVLDAAVTALAAPYWLGGQGRAAHLHAARCSLLVRRTSPSRTTCPAADPPDLGTRPHTAISNERVPVAGVLCGHTPAAATGATGDQAGDIVFGERLEWALACCLGAGR